MSKRLAFGSHSPSQQQQQQLSLSLLLEIYYLKQERDLVQLSILLILIPFLNKLCPKKQLKIVHKKELLTSQLLFQRLLHSRMLYFIRNQKKYELINYYLIKDGDD